MKMAQIIQMSNSEINDNLNNLRRELLNLRFQKATGEFNNYSRFKSIKKMIARLKTKISIDKLKIKNIGK